MLGIADRRASRETASSSAATTSARTAGNANPPGGNGQGRRLIAAYVEAGYTKIHLDCSMSCADDPAVLDDEVVAGRAARLMRVAEDAAHRGGTERPMYVIGTEVPVPGGAHETLDTPHPDAGRPGPADDRRASRGLRRAGLQHVWPRVMALVVQPGVEFDHLHVIDYERSATVELRRVLDGEDAPGLRGALHRLPAPRAAARAGRRPLGGAEGRARH